MKLTSLAILSCKAPKKNKVDVSKQNVDVKQMQVTHEPSGPGRPVLLAKLCVHGGRGEAYKLDTAVAGSCGSTTAASPARALCM